MKDELPRGWVSTKIGDVAHFVRGVTYSKKHSSKEPGEGLIPVLRANNIGIGLNFDGLVYVPERFVSPEQIVRTGDVVLAMSSGSKSVVGKAAVANSLPRCGFGAFCGVIRPSKVISHSLLGYYFQTKTYRNAVSDVSKGVNINNLKAAHVLDRPLPLPPRAEQIRVAAKIDELFSRIDEGERALARVEKLVERYRQSVLKAAVTGELTRDWRAARKAAGEPLESGQALLERILVARREAWETAERAKLQAKGKPPTNDAWKKKYRPPQPPDTTDLPELPEGWVWASLDMIADVTGGITVDAKRTGDDCVSVPYLRVANVQRGFLKLAEIKSLLAPAARVDALKLKVGDILFNEGGDLDKLGRGWIWEGQIPVCIHQNHVFRARLFIPGSWPKLISWYANEMGRAFFLSKGKQTTNLASISLTKLKALPVPMMCDLEAAEIENHMNAELVALEHQMSEISTAATNAAALRQSILKAAFAGQLVPQDPNDEPASALLERIAAERATTASAKARRGRKRADSGSALQSD